MEFYRVSLFVIIIVGSACSSSQELLYRDLTYDDQMCPSDQVDFQEATVNVITCARRCDDVPGCKSLIYLQENTTCFGLKSDNPFNMSTALTGAVFYRPNVPQTTVSIMSAGTTMTTTTAAAAISPSSTVTIASAAPLFTNVEDSQLTASSEYNPNYAPTKARLNNTAHCWTPIQGSQNQNQWIQVDFIDLVVATGVITSGDPQSAYWVTSYRLLTSNDCLSFLTIKDGVGDIIYTGNTDQNTEVTTPISPPVTCRCLQVNPYAWSGNYISLRFEVLGYKA